MGNSIDIKSKSNAALIEQNPKESNNVFNCGAIPPLLNIATTSIHNANSMMYLTQWQNISISMLYYSFLFFYY